MRVSEVFGPTLQGEGPNAGRPAAFLRLGGCNLTCTWCDTPYAWDASRFDLRKEITDMGEDEVADQIVAMGVNRLVITGGEPLLQQRHLASLLTEIAYAVPHVEVETNGTRYLTDDEFANAVEQFNVSPKLAHAGQGDKAIQPGALRDLQRSGKAVFKFVVREPLDIAEIEGIVARCGLTDIWLMPEGTTKAIADELGWLCDAAIARGWSVTPRLHTLAWGEVRGR